MPIDRILFYFCISKLYASELNKLLIYLINLYFHLQIRTNLRISIFLHFWRGHLKWDFFKFKLKKRFLRYFQLNNFLDIFLSIWCNFIYKIYKINKIYIKISFFSIFSFFFTHFKLLLCYLLDMLTINFVNILNIEFFLHWSMIDWKIPSFIFSRKIYNFIRDV